jgi:hypothetical protein
MPLAGRSRVDESRCHTGYTSHFSLISTYSRLRLLEGRGELSLLMPDAAITRPVTSHRFAHDLEVEPDIREGPHD